MGLNQVNWNKEREKLGDSFPQLRAIEYDNKKIYIFDTLKWSIPFDINTSSSSSRMIKFPTWAS